jgi:hypothetical protein
VRRVALVAVAALAFAPAAHAGCGITASALAGRAPLAVTLTAQCASSSYAWDFGDGAAAAGQTVQHSFAAGSYRVTLTSDAGRETACPVTSVSLRVTAPRRARYGSWVALHAQVVPRIPVTWHGRRFQHGALRVRVLALADAALWRSLDTAHVPRARVPMWIATTIYGDMPPGSTVYVYR